MKHIQLADKVYSKILKGQIELYARDFDNGLKGCTPGEWVIFTSEKEFRFIGYVNPFALNQIVARVVTTITSEQKDLDPGHLIQSFIQRAWERRIEWKGFSHGCRIIYGQADELPGLIADCYKNAVIVQVNTAGMDGHRQVIANCLERLTERKVYFLDNQEYRKSEVLPQMESEDLPQYLDVEESGFFYQLPAAMIQKIGYYYDHRHNRLKLKNSLESLNKKFTHGLDLFSYMGSWGLHLLGGRVEKVTFVDQGDFAPIYQKTMELNNIADSRWEFIRNDVFAQLDQFKSAGKSFDIIVSDPPAFKKKEQNKDKALGGYQKLHAKILQLIAPNGYIVAASCTHGISLAELDKTVADASTQVNRQVRLVDVGIQAPDHPFKNLSAKEHYIKYLLYRVD